MQIKNINDFSIRDLTPDEQSAAVLESIEKGATFRLDGKTYTIIQSSERQVRIKCDDGRVIQYKKNVNHNYGNNKFEKLCRDIEGRLTVDLTNENDPLYEMSDIYKLALRGMKKQQDELRTINKTTGVLALQRRKGCVYVHG